MSAHTTLRITRKKALELMLKNIHKGISDDMLEKFMDDLLEPHLYNAIIVDNDYPKNDDNTVPDCWVED